MYGIVANLRNTGGQNDYYALQNTFLLYRDEYDFTYSDGRNNPFRLQYIDFEHSDHNIFRCVNQFIMEQGREKRRPDILFFVNGISVCIVELKNPTKQNATIRDAHTQICTCYIWDIPALLKYCSLSTNEMTEHLPTASSFMNIIMKNTRGVSSTKWLLNRKLLWNYSIFVSGRAIPAKIIIERSVMLILLLHNA